jgi:hypothetical protein
MAIRMNEDELRSLGHGDLIPPRVARASNLNELGQNKTEARFDRKLADLKHGGHIVDYSFESLKFRLAGRTWYTPDFVAALPGGSMIVYEVKGFWRDDARVKIKVAAEMYPHFRWFAVRWVGGEWVFDWIRGRRAQDGG